MSTDERLKKERELEGVRKQSFTTRRATVPDLEDILYKPFPVLDHGFIRVIDYMGDDAAIVQAARVSYGAGTKTHNDDKGLIRYLRRHLHTTPSEMCEIKLHIKLPIFVARQWIRHRTASVNEYSARYSLLDKEFYLPDAEHIEVQSTTNRQGREGAVSPSQAAEILELLRKDAETSYDHYEQLLNDDGTGNPRYPAGPMLAREIARMNLPINFYTQWYWKIDLHNLFHFLMLRTDAHAQYEIRAYADVLLNIVRTWVPMSTEAFEEYQKHSVKISRTGMSVLRRMLKGERITQQESGLNKREWLDLMKELGLEK